MSTIEEKLWDFIDGNCSAIEKEEIQQKIASDEQYFKIYQELLLIDQELDKIDLEEPSLSFTRNVMEKVELEIPPVALKTKIDHRIIYSIAAFFLVSILGIFGYVLIKSDLRFNLQLPHYDFSVNTSIFKNQLFLQLFIFIDVALGLIYLDSFLRKENAQKKGSA